MRSRTDFWMSRSRRLREPDPHGLLWEDGVEGDARTQILVVHLSLLRAIYSILVIWLDQHQKDFLQPPELLCLRLLQAYIQVNVPESSIEHQVQLLFSELKNFEPPEAEMESEDNYWGNVAF